jgi:glycosyltransferase involved in cell wall biosynthesis
MKLSVVIPLNNEAGNIRQLIQEIEDALSQGNPDFEIIAVDDGSIDESYSILQEISQSDKLVRIIRLRANYGQTAALSAGIDHASGDIIVSIDGDLENDPKDIPRLLETLNGKYDVVSGWRKDRWSKQLLSRKIPSVAANWIIAKVTGIPLHDFGCTLKAYRREAIVSTQLYGNMHRYLPALVALNGGKIAEIPISCRPRIHGKSKYGLSRTFTVMLDLIVLRYIHKYMNKPMYFFGGLGLISFFFGCLSGLLAVILKILQIRDFIKTPLLLFASLFLIIGIQLVVFGALGEILMRTYYEVQDKKFYVIKETVGL